ncbi:DUF2637 domain-containing protein [Streptomyces sp. NPDC002533]
MDEWVRRLCALVVARVAAYASYVYQREFALRGGADPVRASLWPLSVDGLLMLSTAGLLRPVGMTSRRSRRSIWSAFMLGMGVSLAANIAAAPALAWRPVLVAGWPRSPCCSRWNYSCMDVQGARTEARAGRIPTSRK